MQDWLCWNSGQEWTLIHMAPFPIGIPVTVMLACGWVFTVMTVKCKHCKSLFCFSIIFGQISIPKVFLNRNYRIIVFGVHMVGKMV